MDAEVVDGEASPSPPTGHPVPAPQPQPAPVPQPQPAPTPAGDCVSSGPEYYAQARASLAADCELYSFCRRVPVGGGGSSPAPPPAGACVSNDPSIDYTVACKALEASCELYSFCKRGPSLMQSAAHAAQRKRLRRSLHRVLLQQGSELHHDVEWDAIESEMGSELHDVEWEAIESEMARLASGEL